MNSKVFNEGYSDSDIDDYEYDNQKVNHILDMKMMFPKMNGNQ